MNTSTSPAEVAFSTNVSCVWTGKKEQMSFGSHEEMDLYHFVPPPKKKHRIYIINIELFKPVLSEWCQRTPRTLKIQPGDTADQLV